METATNEVRRRPAYSGNRGRSKREAAEVLGVSERTLERQIAAGRVKAVDVSPRRRIITDDEIARILSGDAA